MHFYYDLIIFQLLTISVLPAIIILKNRKKRIDSWEAKHKKKSLIISLVLLFFASIIFWGSFVEPRIIKIKETKIDLPNINEPIKIALIADFQAGKSKKDGFIKKVVKKTLNQNPDLILLGGDFVDNDSTIEDETKYLYPLQELAKNKPTFAVPGNHEYGIPGGPAVKNPKFRFANQSKQVEKYLKNLGIVYLINNLQEVEIKQQKIFLFGGDEFWTGNLNFSELEKKNFTERQPTVALIHNPSAVFEATKYNIDLMLSGHTHGGQIRLPFIGPLGIVDDVLPTKWYKGLHEYNGLKFFITSGVGESGTRARLFNFPEINIITVY